jgi:hypothetical protein
MLTRRQFLGATAASLAVPLPLRHALADDADLVLRLIAEPGNIALWKGAQTQVLRYTATVARGRAGAVKPSNGVSGPRLNLNAASG